MVIAYQLENCDIIHNGVQYLHTFLCNMCKVQNIVCINDLSPVFVRILLRLYNKSIKFRSNPKGSKIQSSKQILIDCLIASLVKPLCSLDRRRHRRCSNCVSISCECHVLVAHDNNGEFTKTHLTPSTSLFLPTFICSIPFPLSVRESFSLNHALLFPSTIGGTRKIKIYLRAENKPTLQKNIRTALTLWNLPVFEAKMVSQPFLFQALSYISYAF
jgi:hypothetical protein